MTSSDNHLWLKLWRDRQTEFHQKSVNQLLIKFWPSLKLIHGSRVFVPLCGKSLDMIWLAKQGYEVIGVELSPIAVKAFFKENHLRPVKRRSGNFTLWQHGNITILCGDYFSLTKAHLGHIDMVYDRAALTALPGPGRKLYVAHMRLIVPATTGMFLLTIEDVDENEIPKQAPHVDEEIKSLYSKGFEINLAHIDNVFEFDPESPNQTPIPTEYKVYLLSSRSGL